MQLKEIFSFENLYAAHLKCRLSKQHKRGTVMFEIELGANLHKLNKQLINKKYKLSPYKTFKIFDPKERLIEALPYKDRVVLMCFCENVLKPYFETHLIYDNAASRENKGGHFATQRLHRFMHALYRQQQTRSKQEKTADPGLKNATDDPCHAYYLKCDISKYFQSINHDILIGKLKKCGFTEDEMWFMTLVIQSHGTKGLPLGNQTSQWFALLYLDEIDRLVKERLRAPYYIRYMDDFIVLSADKTFLRHCKEKIETACRENLALDLNAKTQIGRLKDGVDFLGFNHKLTPTGKIVKRIRASTKQRGRQYLKSLAWFYAHGYVDDAYIDARICAYKDYLKGTKWLPFVLAKLNQIKRQNAPAGK